VVRGSPPAICDDGIAEALQLSARQHANHKTCALADARGCDRRKNRCSICRKNKLVIRYA
jgi:hypothetical protein